MPVSKNRSGRCLGVALAAITFAPTAIAGTVDWPTYARHSGSLAFVTSGVSMLEPCAVPIEYSESKEDGLRTLEVYCREEDNAAMARVIFYSVENGDGGAFLIPWKIELIP